VSEAAKPAALDEKNTLVRGREPSHRSARRRREAPSACSAGARKGLEGSQNRLDQGARWIREMGRSRSYASSVRRPHASRGAWQADLAAGAPRRPRRATCQTGRTRAGHRVLVHSTQEERAGARLERARCERVRGSCDDGVKASAARSKGARASSHDRWNVSRSWPMSLNPRHRLGAWFS